MIDSYAFDPVMLRNTGISGPREIMAHEIGHMRAEQMGLQQTEVMAHQLGARVPGLSLNQMLNLLGFGHESED